MPHLCVRNFRALTPGLAPAVRRERVGHISGPGEGTALLMSSCIVKDGFLETRAQLRQ